MFRSTLNYCAHISLFSTLCSRSLVSLLLNNVMYFRTTFTRHNKFLYTEHTHITYSTVQSVLILWLISRCAAVSFPVTRRFPFTMASTAAVPSGVTTVCAWPGRGESVTELMAFMNCLVHWYTCCSDRHASPYWTFIRRWISVCFTPSLLKKRMTERCYSLVHVASGAAIFTPLLRRRVALLHRTATCRPLFKAWVSFLSTYKTIEMCFDFLSHFLRLSFDSPS